MDIQKIKQIMKEKKISTTKLAELSGIPRQTIKCVLLGITKNPRVDTLQAIEKALGLYNTKIELSEEKKNLLEKIEQLTKEEKQACISFIDLMLSKRN